jgi:hypothetical protein
VRMNADAVSAAAGQRGVGRGGLRIQPQRNPMNELCGQCAPGKLCVTAEARCHPCVFSRFADLGDARSGLRQVLSSTALGSFKREMDAVRSETAEGRGCNPYGCPPHCGPHCGPLCSPTCNRCIPQS